MQRFFSVIIIFAILVVGGGWVLMKKSEEEAKVKRAEELASARRTLADKARAAAREADTDAYMRSVRGALAAYQEELKKKVYAKKPEAFDTAEYKKLVDEKFVKGEIKEQQQKSMLEGYEIVRQAYDTLMAGSWKSLLSAPGKSDTRLDVYEVKRSKTDEGQPILEAKFFLWGVDESVRLSWGPLAIRYWKTEKEKVKEGREMVEKDVDKVLGKVDGDATPHIIVQTGNKYIKEFPPYVSIGYMWLPVMPREASSADIELSYTMKGSGGESQTGLKWEKLKIPDAWRLGEGESWEADTVEATEDEIAGKEGKAGEGAEGEKAAEQK